MTRFLSDEEWLAQLNFIMGKTPKLSTGKKLGPPFKPLDEQGIIALHNEGMSNRQIAELLDQPRRTIDYRINKLKKEGLIK